MDNRFMRRVFSFIALIAVILSSLTACEQAKQSETRISASDDTNIWTPPAPVTAMALTKEEPSIYDTTVGILLTQDLWTERDTYDAAHYLMIPMHYAFQSGNAQYISMLLRLFLTVLRRTLPVRTPMVF